MDALEKSSALEKVLFAFVAIFVVVPMGVAFGRYALDFRISELQTAFFAVLLQNVGFAVLQSAASAALALALGLALGIWLALTPGRAVRLVSAWVSALGNYAFVMPGVAVALAVLDLHERGLPVPEAGFFAIVAAHVSMNALAIGSFTEKRLLQGLARGDADLLEVATMLTPRKWYALRTVFGRVFAEVARSWGPLVFLWSFQSFGTVLVLASQPTESGPEVLLYHSLWNDPSSARALVLALLNVGLGIFLVRKLTSRPYAEDILSATSVEPPPAARPAALGAIGFVCAVLASLVPVWTLLGPVAGFFSGASLAAFDGEATASTILLCLAHGAVVAGLGLCLVASRSRARTYVTWGLGLSTSVFALGWMAIGWDRFATGVPAIFVGALAGSAVRLPWLAAWIEARLRALPPELSEAAALLGGSRAVMWRLRWPFCRDVVWRAAVLSFVSMCGDVAIAGIFLRDVPTLASSAQRAASRYDFSGSSWLLGVLAGFAVLGMFLQEALLRRYKRAT